MLDLQAFTTDHLANSTHSRLALLVDSLPRTTKSLVKLSNSLLTCTSTYSLSATLSSASWAEEDVADLEKDYSALPRLFQLSIVLKGPVYDRFVASRGNSAPTNETPGQRRAAFIEWCIEQNPILRPTPGGGGGLIVRTAPPKSSWPTEAKIVGLGLPTELTSGGSLMRRAVSQPPPTALETPLVDRKPDYVVTTKLMPPTFIPNESTRQEEEEHALDQITDTTKSAPLTLDPSTVELPASPSPFDLSLVNPFSTSVEIEELSTASPPSSVAALAPVPPKPFDNDEPSSHFLDRSTSTVSSMAMTTSSSMGSVLFEPVLAPFESEVPQGEKESEEMEQGGSRVEQIEVAEGRLGEPEIEEDVQIVEMGEVVDKDETKEHGTADGVTEHSMIEAASTSALDVPLPLSPLATEEFTTIDENRHTSTPAPLELLPSTPIDLPILSPPIDSTPFLEPPPLPPSPALPQSPSLIITSFDETTDELPPSPPPKSSKPFRILSLDGGGLVGPIPQLIALKKHLALNSDSSLPSQHFDLIVGTSSSALPTLLLGQFRLSIDETLDVLTRVARQALRLEGTAAAPGQTKPKRGGKWSRLFSKSSRTTSAAQVIPRRTALESAIKQFVPAATSSLPLSRSSCQTAVLAYQRTSSTSSRAQQCWLDSESDLTLLEIVQASMALPGSSSSPFVSSPTSLNPSSSALSHASGFVDSLDQPIELISLSIGYSLASITLDSKRTSRTRLDALRQIKEFGAGNAASAEALSKRLEKDARVNLIRIEANCDGAELVRADEGDLVESIRAQIEGRRRAANTASSRNRQSKFFSFLAPPLSPSSPLNTFHSDASSNSLTSSFTTPLFSLVEIHGLSFVRS